MKYFRDEKIFKTRPEKKTQAVLQKFEVFCEIFGILKRKCSSSAINHAEVSPFNH